MAKLGLCAAMLAGAAMLGTAALLAGAVAGGGAAMLGCCMLSRRELGPDWI
jgi:hypothetical protein